MKPLTVTENNCYECTKTYLIRCYATQYHFIVILAWPHISVEIYMLPTRKWKDQYHIPTHTQLSVWLSGVSGHSAKCTPRHILEAQCAFKGLMIHEVLRFALRIAFRCVLHRCGSQDIRCWKLYRFLVDETVSYLPVIIQFQFYRVIWFGCQSPRCLDLKLCM